jgi:hypothetical protein
MLRSYDFILVEILNVTKQGNELVAICDIYISCHVYVEGHSKKGSNGEERPGTQFGKRW